MNRHSFLLAVSLTVNLGVAVALVTHRDSAGAFFDEVFFSSAHAPTPAAPAVASTPATADGDKTAAAFPPWTPLQPADLNALVVRLRAAGYPTSMIRAIVEAAARNHFLARRRELMPPSEPAEYWRNPPERSFDRAFLAARRKIDHEERQLVRDVLGADAFVDRETPEGLARLRRQFGDLPAAKVAALQKLFADYEDLMEEAFIENASRVSAEGRAKAALLEQEKRADLERLLTPEELLDYDSRNSNAANGLRNRMGAFPVTEAEFRALFPAQKALDESLAGMTRPFTPEKQRRRQDAEQRLEAETRRVLGDARYAEWKLATDPEHQRLVTLAQRLNVPPPAVQQVFAVRAEFQPRIEAVRGNRDLNAHQRDAQLRALAAEARSKLTPLLGAAGVETYQRREGGGAWLAELGRETANVPPADERHP